MIHTLVQAVTHTTVQPVMPFTHTLVHITFLSYRDVYLFYKSCGLPPAGIEVDHTDDQR